MDDYNKVAVDKYKSDYTNIIINDENTKLKRENENLRYHLSAKNISIYDIEPLKENIIFNAPQKDNKNENINENKENEKDNEKENKDYDKLMNDYNNLIDE